MKINKKNLLTIDKYVEEALYNKKFGYYMSQDPFGKKGDFITGPNISVLFSEMIAIWIISFWENLKHPKEFNLIELGAGNGEMMKILIKTFKQFPAFKKACKINILEKSTFLKGLQKKNIKDKNIKWLKDITYLNNLPCIFIANEFFDALPIKQFIKKKDEWYERYVEFSNNKKPKYVDLLFDMKKFEKKLNYKISYKQKFIEYSPLTENYFKKITKKIKSNNGGLLFLDYGYFDKKIKNTLQAVSKHKYSNILNNFGKSDITYNLSFYLIEQIIKKIGSFNTLTTTQKNFLINLGIFQRAEILTKNMPFTKKADIYFRIKRLVDKNEMGNLFKVMFITNKNNKFKLGF
jgi:NADH dehydrogenase [ubiquinone] 1 alpha subcomplex assembly factor 7